MKSTFSLLVVCLFLLMQVNCGNTTASTTTENQAAPTEAPASASNAASIQGTLANASGLTVFLDMVSLSNKNEVLGKSEADAQGKFSFNSPDGYPEGIYRLRIGVQKIHLVLNGKEKDVTISGDLNNLATYGLEVKGSPTTESFWAYMRSLNTGKVNVNELKLGIAQQKPLTAAFLALSLGGQNLAMLDIQQACRQRLNQAMPGTEYAEEFAAFVAQQEALFAQSQARGAISVGQPAPDIALPNPDGKKFALSSLKGKVVLLDFWASWCGPCRRENPNVVQIYNKYKDRGFTVFSVSLDGANTRFLGPNPTPEQLKQANDDAKNRWVQAIQQDGLLWDTHVSDLQHWASAPAKLYGVSSIPRTFLIDKEGRIAAVNIRGAEMLEQEVLKLL